MFLYFVVHNNQLCPLYSHNLNVNINRFSRVAIDPNSSVEKFVYLIRYEKIYDAEIYSNWIVIIAANDEIAMKTSYCEPHEIVLKERLAAPECRSGVMTFYSNNPASPLMSQIEKFQQRHTVDLEIEDKLPIIPCTDFEHINYTKWNNKVSFNIFEDNVYLGSTQVVTPYAEEDELYKGKIYMC